MRQIYNKDIEKLQVSSTVKNDKSLRKQNIFDESDDTCWSSDEGSPQWINIEFKEPQLISGFYMQFQGGFVGQNSRIELNKDELLHSEPFYPDDINTVQKFIISKPTLCKNVKFVFESSSDFFGRVVLYSVDFIVEQ